MKGADESEAVRSEPVGKGQGKGKSGHPPPPQRVVAPLDRPAQEEFDPDKFWMIPDYLRRFDDGPHVYRGRYSKIGFCKGINRLGGRDCYRWWGQGHNRS